MQEHIGSQHVAPGEAFSCPPCSLVCSSQLELQDHLLSCHMETPGASTSHAVSIFVYSLTNNTLESRVIHKKESVAS